MDYQPNDKVVVVTGAGSGIGLATARAFIAEGAKVVGVDLNPGESESLAQEQFVFLKIDLTAAAAGDETLQLARDSFGTPTILVSCAGIAPVRASALDGTDDDWRHSIDVNFLSIVRMCRALVPAMVEAGGGSLVSVASDAARMPDPFFAEYNVTKASILMFMKTLSIEFGPKNIRSNTVSPGPTRTPMWDRPGGFADALASQLDMTPEQAIHHFATEMRRLPWPGSHRSTRLPPSTCSSRARSQALSPAPSTRSTAAAFPPCDQPGRQPRTAKPRTQHETERE